MWRFGCAGLVRPRVELPKRQRRFIAADSNICICLLGDETQRWGVSEQKSARVPFQLNGAHNNNSHINHPTNLWCWLKKTNVIVFLHPQRKTTSSGPENGGINPQNCNSNWHKSNGINRVVFPTFSDKSSPQMRHLGSSPGSGRRVRVGQRMLGEVRFLSGYDHGDFIPKSWDIAWQNHTKPWTKP
jgi:hypothetical protein